MGIVSQTARLGIHVYEDTRMGKVHIYSGLTRLFTLNRYTDNLNWDRIWTQAGQNLADSGIRVDRKKVWYYFVDESGINMVPERMINARILDMLDAYDLAVRRSA